MILITTTENFRNDIFVAQEFVREWAYDNGMSPDESEAKLENELARIIKEIQKFPLSFASLHNAPFIKRARCFFDIYAVEYLIKPPSAKTTSDVKECLLGALVPLKSNRSQDINISTEHFEF